MSLADAFREFNEAANAGPIEIARFLDLGLTRTHLSYKGETYPLGGLRVEIDTAGNISSRPTLTRWLLVGPAALAWHKKIDAREMYLTFEGPAFGFVVSVHPDIAYGARQFAVKVVAAARALDGGNPDTWSPDQNRPGEQL